MTSPSHSTILLAPIAEADALTEFYTFRNRKDVLCFLQENFILASLLKEAYPVLECYFGKEIEVVLEVMHSPEGGDPGPLIAWVYTHASLEEAMAQEALFLEGWWIDHPAQTEAPLLFNMRFA